MKRIDYKPETLTLREGWAEDAEAVLQELLKEDDPKKRQEIIKAHDDLWKDVKGELAKLSFDKCWYTESKQEGTDTDVDHFRPKNRVAEATDKDSPHPGYWWLAFSLANYRFSCIYANRRRKDVETGDTGGKADHFPLIEEGERAWTPTCNCDLEQPVLIDPCVASDVRLLTFKADGEAMPRFNEKSNPRQFMRANVSIELYNLDNSAFVKARQELREKMNSRLDDAKRFFKRLDSGDADHVTAYEKAIDQLLEFVDEKAPYSGFCKAYLEEFRHEEYVEGVF